MEILHFLTSVHTFLGNYYVVLISKITSLFIFTALSIFLSTRKQNSTSFSHLSNLIYTIIIGICVENFSWIITILLELHYISLKYKPITSTIITLAWIFTIFVHQAFGLLLENLNQKTLKIRLHQKIFFLINSIFALLIITLCFTQLKSADFSLFKFTAMKLLPLYLSASILPSVYLSIQTLKSKHLPKIIKAQLNILIYYLAIPYFIFDFIEIVPSSSWVSILTNQINFTPISSFFGILFLVYFTKKIIRLRFLNLSSHVLAAPNTPLPHNTKEYIWRLSNAGSVSEARLIAQGFFKERFNIKEHNIIIHTRTTNDYCAHNTIFCKNCEEKVEDFIAQNKNHSTLLKEQGILTKDELEFDAFYDLYKDAQPLHTFMQTIYCELFIPLFEKDILIGYIGILQNEHHHFYTESDVDQIAIFGNYLCVVLNVLHKKDVEQLRLENKALKEEVFEKHQHINEYKESLKHLVRKNSNKEFGIIMFKEHYFTYLNEDAQTLLGININQQKNHPLTKKLQTFATKIQSYRTTKTVHCKNAYGKDIIVTGMLQLHTNSVLLHINQPDALESLMSHIDVLHDPSTWDYSLYLETTQSGQLINKLIPSNNTIFFNFKIKLLQLALSKKAIALHSNPIDAQRIAHIVHTISLRDTIKTIELSENNNSYDIATMLFGTNPILHPKHPEALFAQLDKRGTLFIKNIEYLSERVQKDLAYFITYGTYTPLHTESTKVADVRIICTVKSDLKELVEQGKIVYELYDALQATSLSLPTFTQLSKTDIHSLIDSFAQSGIQEEAPHFAYLSHTEKEDILAQQFKSFEELHNAIQNIISQKKAQQPDQTSDTIRVTQHLIDNESNPDLIHAAHMGKKCLKSKEMMEKLWKHFKNQSQIASFLGVNRSSVNRRCKKYNLGT